MVAPVREYERQYSAQGADQGRRATAEDFGVAGGLMDLGQGIGQAAAIMQKHEETRELADAQLKMVESDPVWEEQQTELHNKAQPGVSTAKQLQTDMSSYYKTLSGNYKTETARRYVQLHGMKMTQDKVAASARFDVDLAVKDRFAKMDTIFTANSRMAYENPESYAQRRDAILNDSKNRIGVFDMPGDARVNVAVDKEVSRRIEGMAFMAASGAIRDPVVRGQIVGAAQPPAKTNVDLIGSLIQREGGYVVNDAGRGETNFGINKAAHPNVDIKGLTKEKAAEIYKRDYWDAFGIGNLDPSVQAVVFDGVVNHGSQFKTQLVEAAKNGATAQQLGDMRVAEYKRLVESNPEKFGKYEKSWIKRVDETVQMASAPSMVDTPPELKQKPEWWNDLSPEKQIQITNQAITLNNHEKRVAEAALQNTLKDVEAHVSIYGKLPADLPKANAFPDPVQYQKFQAYTDAVRQMEAVIDAPASVQMEALQRMKPEYGKDAPGVFDYKENVYQHSKKMIADANAAREKDQVGAAYSRSFSSASPIKPIEDFEPDNFIKAMNERFPVSDAIAKNAGLKPKHLMNAEAANMNKFINNLTQDELNPWLDKIINGTNDKQRLREVFRQAMPNDKAFQVATDIALSNEVPMERSDTDMNAVLFGRRVMNATFKGTGTEQEKAYKSAMLPSNADAMRQISAYSGQLNIPVGQLETLAEAVTAHYIGSALSKNTNQNLSLSDKDLKEQNKQAFNKSIEAIMGQKNGSYVGTKAGSTVVLRPYAMDEGTFMNRIQQQVDIQTAGKYQWGEYSLNVTPDSKYEVVIAGRPPFVVDPHERPYRDEGMRVPAPTPTAIQSIPEMAYYQ
jgi:hypothetical protein